MLASSSRHVLKRTHNKLCSLGSQVVSEGPIPRRIPRRNASTAAIPVEDTPTRRRKPIRNGPWQYNADHSFQGTYRRHAIARYQLAISDMAEQGQFISCLKLCKQMKDEGVKPDLLIYNNLLMAAANDGLHMEAEGIIDDMLAMGIKPDRQSYHHLIQAHQALEADYMWKIVARMQELDITPNAQTFSLILVRPILGENIEMAVQYMGEMTERGIVPELQTAQSTIVLAAKLGLPKLALEMANTFEEASIRRLDNEVWVNCLISAAENLYAKGVLQAWPKVVKELGITPDEGLCIEVLNTAARHGLPDLGTDALRILKLIGAPWNEHHLAAMIEAFCKADRLKEAFETLQVMRENDIIPVTETTMPIFDLIKNDIEAIDGTWAILDKLKEEGTKVDITAINVIIQATVFRGDVQRAVGTYKSITDYGLSPNIDTFNLLLSACIGVGHRDLGNHLLRDMKNASIAPDVRTYERLIILCLTQATYEDAFFYLEEMKGNAFLPTFGIYDAIIRKCASVGDLRYKLALEEMEQCGYTVSEGLRMFILHGPDYNPPPPKKDVKSQQDKEHERQTAGGRQTEGAPEESVGQPLPPS